MREIKFRYVWKSGEPSLITTEIFNIEQIEDGEVEDFIYSEESELGEKLELIDRNEYTGLRDKNGREIWESDIVQLYGYFNSKVFWNNEIGIWEVYLNPIKDVIDSDLLFNVLDTCEKIGNIYENPDLLKEDDAGD